ncbi:MAG: UbiA family prenyltransferase [Actinomycetales bacterium]
MTGVPLTLPPSGLRLAHGVRSLALAWLEARPVVLMVFALRFLVGGMLSRGAPTNGVREAEGGVAWLLSVWFVYLLNGIFDIAGDRRNGSNRPLASGALDRRFAANLCAVLATASLAMATLVGFEFALGVAVMLVLGVVYSVGTGAAKKSAFMALFVAASGSTLTYLAGSEAFTSRASFPSVAFAVVTGLWIAVAGHTKDFGDTAGDRQEGRRTLPILVGDRVARILIAWAALVVGACGAVVALVVPRVPTLSFLLPGSVALFVVLRARSRRSTRSAEKRPYRTFMLVQYAVNATAIIW